jgi:hypothetical protein
MYLWIHISKGFGYPKSPQPQPGLSKKNYNARTNVKCFPHYTYKVKKLLGPTLFILLRDFDVKIVLFNMSQINNLHLGGALTFQIFYHHHLPSPGPGPKRVEDPRLGV